MLEHALQYAGRGWRVFPLSGKIPFKGSHGHLDASCDPATVAAMWRRRPRANIGLATGALVVIDADGPASIERLKQIGARLGGLPQTLTAQTARGLHLYYLAPPGTEIRTRNEPREVKGADGIDIKGAGGYVALPPSINHKTGFVYKWLLEVPPAELPLQLLHELTGEKPNKINNPLGPLPAYLAANNEQSQTHLTERASAGLTPWSPEEEDRVWSALCSIPARGYDNWRTIGMALQSLCWIRSDGTDIGFELFDEWSATEDDQYSQEATEKKWASFGRRSGITIATLFHIAEQHGWTGNLPQEYGTEVVQHQPGNNTQPRPDNPLFAAPGGVDLKVNGTANGHHAGPTLLPGAFTARTHGSPLIELNEKYAVIGDVGGKCMVMGWAPSPADPAIEIPSFQTFKTFQERHSHRYVATRPKRKVVEEAEDGEEEREWQQLGAAWLKWPKRRSFERLDLVPGAGELLPNGALNLWRGFGVTPKPGSWARMKAHIAEVLADNNAEALHYIVKWSAWAVQNPDKPAGAALVFRGGQGAGKGVFARTMCKLFGQHGVQLYNSKHMVGFNGLLRNCILLYADEAFWAGDKQGESTLKGLITEPSLVIESKGLNAEIWKNRIHLIMTSNADWVIPAGHDSRRYSIFDVSESRKQNSNYFEPLYAELDNGGREAMLHDLLHVELKGWAPHNIVKNTALLDQKTRSLDPLADWYLHILSEGRLPAVLNDGRTVPSAVLYANAQLYSRQLANTLTATRLGLFLKTVGCVKRMNAGKAGNNGWMFPTLPEARQQWERRYGTPWAWDDAATEWQAR